MTKDETIGYLRKQLGASKSWCRAQEDVLTNMITYRDKLRSKVVELEKDRDGLRTVVDSMPKCGKAHAFNRDMCVACERDAMREEVARAQFSEKMMQSQCSKAEKEMRDHLHRVIDEKNHLRDALDEACTWIMDSGFPAIVKHLREVAGGKESK